MGRKGTGSHAAFMTTAMHLCFESDAWLAAHIQRTDALGAVHLMRRHRQQVDFHGLHVEEYLTRTLSRINMQ